MLATMAVRLELASRVQLVAWVAPLAKVPKTIVIAADQVMVSPGSILVIACQPPAWWAARYIETTSRMNISGTDTRDSASSPL